MAVVRLSLMLYPIVLGVRQARVSGSQCSRKGNGS